MDDAIPQNPCAPAEAVAVKIKSGNKQVLELLNKINNLDVFKDVEGKEKTQRRRLSSKNRRKHKNHPLGKITTEKGLTPENELIDKGVFHLSRRIIRIQKSNRRFLPEIKRDFKIIFPIKD